MSQWMVKAIKEAQFRSPLRRYFFPKYGYCFSPPQLCFLCECLEQTKHVAGTVAEIGCSTGETTVFLAKYLEATGVRKRYVAVDTFAGFVPEDINVEVKERGKNVAWFNGFRANSKRWFDGTMQLNRVSVESIQADVNRFDLRSLAPFSFVLLDVDLYRPIKKALPELYETLAPGGIIAVDDCDAQNERWDGSDQAYKEFIQQHDLPLEIAHGKIGVIRKASS